MRSFAMGASLVAVSLVGAPGHAGVSTDASVADSYHVGFNAPPDPQLDAYIDVTIERTRRVQPDTDPGPLFPIVIDPEDPPDPGVGAVTETLYAYGWGSICDWNIGMCAEMDGEISIDPAAQSFDDVPLPGNSGSIEFAIPLRSWAGDAYSFTVSFQFKRPGCSMVQPDLPNDVNAWLDAPNAHASAEGSLLHTYRGCYELTGTVATSFGEHTWDIGPQLPFYVEMSEHIAVAGAADI